MPATECLMDHLRLAELLCTRLCHDLTGPIGAVNNGAEFLSEEGFNLQGQAVELITSSAFSAVARLQFYRMAYGHVKDSGEASLADSKHIADDFFQGTKIVIDWPDQYTDASGVSLSQRMIRLLFNLLIVVSGVLIRGGRVGIAIQPREGGGKTLSLTATGDHAKWDVDTELALTKELAIAQTTPKNIQLVMTRLLAKDLGVSLTFTPGTDELRIDAVQPAREESSAAMAG